MERLNIGVARLAPMYIVENNYEEQGLSASFIQGFLKLMSDDHNIKICTKMNPEDELVLNNTSLIKRNPYIGIIDYSPSDNNSDLDVIYIFPREIDSQKKELYETHILNLLDGFEGTVFYMQYNEELFPLLEKLNLDKINFVVLSNTDINAGYIYNNDMYGQNYDIDGYSLDLNSLVYNTRTSRDKQYFIKMSLISDKFKEEYNKLTMTQNNIYFIGNYEDNEYHPGFEYDNYEGYKNLLYKLKHTTMIFVDNVYKYLYNPYFIKAANYTLPIIINEELKIPKEFKFDYIKLPDEKGYKQFILHKTNNKLLKQLRAGISSKYKKDILKKELYTIIEKQTN